MGLIDRLFGRRPPLRDLAELADFIDGNAAFLVQKGIYEYSRARAGHYAKVLLVDPEFGAAIEVARWRAFPLGLAMLGEMTDATLAPHAAADRIGVLRTINDVVLSVFDRYPVPPALQQDQWMALRQDLAHQLDLITLHPPKRVMDIAIPFAKRYWDLMPIHEKLRSADEPTTRNYLRISLINMHDELTKRMDAPELIAALRSRSAIA